MGKIPFLLMCRIEVVCNIWSHALKFGWVRLPPCKWSGEKWFCNIWSHELEFGWVRLPLANGQEGSCLQQMESCTAVWVCKTPPSLMQRREVVYNIWSHALVFGWVRLPPYYGQERSGLQHLESCTGVWVGKTPPFSMFRRQVVWNIWSLELEFG